MARARRRGVIAQASARSLASTAPVSRRFAQLIAACPCRSSSRRWVFDAQGQLERYAGHGALLEETRNNQLLAQIKDHPPVPLLKKVVSCTAEQLGLHSLLGPPAGYVGRPIPGTKPFVMGNAAKGTSLAGKAARWLFGDLEFESAMPTLVGGPFARKALKVSFTKSVGTFAGRAVPVLGWALISYDVVSIAACTAR